MKIALYLSLFLAVAVATSLKNTTAFFSKELGSNLTIQTYSGYEDIDWYYPNKTASIYYSLWQGSYLSWQDYTVLLIIWIQAVLVVPVSSVALMKSVLFILLMLMVQIKSFKPHGDGTTLGTCFVSISPSDLAFQSIVTERLSTTRPLQLIILSISSPTFSIIIHQKPSLHC